MGSGAWLSSADQGSLRGVLVSVARVAILDRVVVALLLGNCACSFPVSISECVDLGAA